MEYKNPKLKRQFDLDYTNCNTCTLHETLRKELNPLQRTSHESTLQKELHIRNKCWSEWNCTGLFTAMVEVFKANKAWKTAGNECNSAKDCWQHGLRFSSKQVEILRCLGIRIA